MLVHPELLQPSFSARFNTWCWPALTLTEVWETLVASFPLGSLVTDGPGQREAQGQA